jgi:hypothetical protein
MQVRRISLLLAPCPPRAKGYLLIQEPTGLHLARQNVRADGDARIAAGKLLTDSALRLEHFAT